MDIVYTIGHSNHEIGDFLCLLNKHGIDLILDVRSTPYSKRYPQFNREELQVVLQSHQLAYKGFGLWFGARQAALPCLHKIRYLRGRYPQSRSMPDPRVHASLVMLRKGSF